MGSVILLLASQALAVATPVPGKPPPGARVSAVATAEILRAETTRDEGTAMSLQRHRRTNSDGRVAIEFE